VTGMYDLSRPVCHFFLYLIMNGIFLVHWYFTRSRVLAFISKHKNTALVSSICKVRYVLYTL